MSKISFELPKYTVEHVMQTFSEVYDWGLRDLNVPEIHKQTLGNEIKIAIIDSGKSEHFETEEATMGAKNFSSSPHLTDKNGHSTFCAGIIAARKNNEGVIGVAPLAKLYFGKAMDDAGRGDPSALVKAINWAISQKVDVISISAGMFFDFKPLHRVVKKAYRRNIITIAAVGNSGKRQYDVAFPARYPEVIGIAAYDQRHKVAKFSSRGINVSFAMPGVNIYSTYLNNQFCKLSGTSFACPIMSGICALILAKHRQGPSSTPCETPKQMMEHLTKYAKKLENKKETGFGTIDLEGLFSSD
ncbi:MAG: S8 family peptidase [Promethearchaeota archaeon]|jgi:subtilisin family serine protease